jgi:RNA polymerase sigma factor (sigma-70 family)
MARTPAGADLQGQLVERHTAYLRATCRGLCASAGLWPGDADDLFQRTWLKVAQCPPGARPKEGDDVEWRRWLAAIARNSFRDDLRRDRSRRARDREHGSEVLVWQISATSDAQVKEEVFKAMQDILEEHCNERQRSVVRLCLEGLSVREIAGRLCIRTSAARVALNQALAILRTELEARGLSAS